MKVWKKRALKATEGSQFGAILASALGKTIPAPCYTGRATITSDGYVMANFTDRDGNNHLGAFVGSVDDLINNTQGLAKHLELSIPQRHELVETIRSWVATDYRH